MTTNDGIDEFNIDPVELAVLYIFCREPEAVHLFDAPASDILNPVTRTVVGAAQRLKEQGEQVIIENIAAVTGIAISQLEYYGRKVTRRMREDWGSFAKLVRLAAQKRALLDWYVEQRERLIRTPLPQLAAFNTHSRTDLALRTTDVNRTQASRVGDIVDEMESGAISFISDPIATSIPLIDTVLMGGVRPGEIHVIGGAMKSGKTTLARNIALNMNFARVVHIAADGGHKYKHTCYYTAMLAMRSCREAGYPTRVDGYRGDALHPKNVAIWYANRVPNRPKRELLVPIVPKVEEALLAARSYLRELRTDGYLAIYDTKMIGFSIDNLLAFIEREHFTNDVQVIIIDHVGKFGDKRKFRIFERIESNAQLLVELFNRLPMVGIILSQRNAVGVSKHNAGEETEDSDGEYSANLEGGKSWEQEADSIWIVRRPKGKPELNVKPKLVREEDSAFSTETYQLHAPSGLILL